MQRERAPPPGLSTEIPRDAPPIAPPPPLSTDLPMRAAPEQGGFETAARLAALEAGLRSMSAREADRSRAELQSMLDANAAVIRADICSSGRNRLTSRGAHP